MTSITRFARTAAHDVRRAAGRRSVVTAAVLMTTALVAAAIAVGSPSRPAAPGDQGQVAGQGAAVSSPGSSPAVSTAPERSAAPVLDTAGGQEARSDRFWHQLTGFFEASGPRYRSLDELGARSEAIVLGTFTGQVELGRVIRDSRSDPNAGVFFANVTFGVDEVLAGSLPEAYRQRVQIEFMIRREEAVASLAEVVPTERSVLFIASRYLRRAGIEDVYFLVGLGAGTFRELADRVAPVGLPVDPQRGRLEGMPFDEFVDLVREVPVLDLLPEGS